MAPLTISNVTNPNQLAIWFTMSNAAGCRPAANSSFRVGTNAAVSAPSPNSRRNKFGNVNAVTKAEANPLAPNMAVTKTSRASPKNRENTVAKETMLIC